jgi:uncharacterized protein DUF4129
MKSGGGRITPTLTALGVLILLGVVAVAATGSTPTGTGEGRTPGDILLDTFFSLMLVAFVAGAVLLVYGLMQRKAIAQEVASGPYRRSKIASIIGLAFVFLLLTFLQVRKTRLFREQPREELSDTANGPGPAADGSGRDLESGYQPEFAWIPVLVVLGLIALAITVYVLAGRRERRELSGGDGDVAERLADILDDTLDDLRREPDPRRAVIATYARLERGFAASGLPRRPAETAEEYIVRILGRLEVDPDPVRKLTDLFEHAKFSPHPVDHMMKDDAIGALAEIRDELRAVAGRREEERARAHAAREQAATS